MAQRPSMDIRHSDSNTSCAYMEPQYIVVHYTAGSGDVARDGTRFNLCSYFANGYRGASANYFIDNGGIAEYADPDERFTWHCGDGDGVYGITNANSIGIEVCAPDYSEDPYSDEEIRHLRSLVTWLMDRYGIDKEHVVRHYDASRKCCPWYYTQAGNGGDDAWYELRDLITSEERQDREEDGMSVEQYCDYRYIELYVGDMYRCLLHRDPDRGGQKMWTKEAANYGWNVVANSILGCDEYQSMRLDGVSRVRDMYAWALGRECIDDECKAWLDAKDGDLYAIINGVLDSDEAAKYRESIGL